MPVNSGCWLLANTGWAVKPSLSCYSSPVPHGRSQGFYSLELPNGTYMVLPHKDGD